LANNVNDRTRSSRDIELLFMGVILGFLAQGTYDILKDTYGTFYPSLSASWLSLLSVLPITLLFIFAMRIPALSELRRQHRPVLVGRWRYLFFGTVLTLGIIEFLYFLLPHSLVITVLVVIIGAFAFYSFFILILQIRSPIVETPTPDYEPVLREILEELQTVKKELDRIPKH